MDGSVKPDHDGAKAFPIVVNTLHPSVIPAEAPESITSAISDHLKRRGYGPRHFGRGDAELEGQRATSSKTP